MQGCQRLRFKLHSLNYPAADVFDLKDITHVRNFIVWVEDRIIRALPAKERLRDVTSVDWESYLTKYLAVIKCPFTESTPWALMDQLISKAMLMEPMQTPISTNSDGIKPTSTNSFAHIDVDSQEFKDNVKKLAKQLQIPTHPDIKQMFKAICLLVEQKLGNDVLNKAIQDYEAKKVDMLKLEDVCLGFDIDDPIVKAAAIALRLLNVNRMRTLQDQANASIVQVQRITADPKTDEKLGKVGF